MFLIANFSIVLIMFQDDLELLIHCLPPSIESISIVPQSLVYAALWIEPGLMQFE